MNRPGEPTIGPVELAEAMRQMFDEWRHRVDHPAPITDPMPRWKYERLRELAEAPGASEAVRAWFAMAEPVDDWTETVAIPTEPAPANREQRRRRGRAPRKRRAR